ncbi:hypothetical protein ACJW31_03G184500 [Castanea mollissima]
MFIRPLYWCDIYIHDDICISFFVFEVNDMYITLIMPLLPTALIALNNDLLWLIVIYHLLPYYIFHAKWPKRDLWKNRRKRQYKPILNDIVFSSKTIQTHPK